MREFLAFIVLPLIVASVCGYYLWLDGGLTKEGWLPTDCNQVCAEHNMTQAEDITNLSQGICKCQTLNLTIEYIEK